MAGRNNNGEGYIGKTKDGKWTARIQYGVSIDGKQKIKAFYGKTQKEVRQKLKEFQNGGDVAKPDGSLACFGEYIIKWYNLYKKNSVKATTYDRREALMQNHIIPKIGHIQMRSLNIDHLQEFFNYMYNCKFSDDYMKKAKQLINGCLAYAEVKGDIKKNLVSDALIIPKSLSVPKDIVVLDEEEIQKFVAEATRTYKNGKPVYRYGQGLKFILYTGLRIGEALNLKWEDIDLKRCVVEVRGNLIAVKNRNKKNENDNNYILIPDSSVKTKNSVREVELCNSAIDALRELRIIQQPARNSERIFATANGQINNRRNLQSNISSIIKKAEIKVTRFSIHSLRHTFASMLFRRGVDVKAVSELLGHSNVTFTYNRYIHLIKEQKKDAISLLNKM